MEHSSSASSSRSSSQSPNMQGSSPIVFSNTNKISAYSLERRIDYHLERIMKKKRLVYFKNSIEMLSIENRINESLLEIVTSSFNLVERRQTLLSNAQQLYEQLMNMLINENFEQTLEFASNHLASLKEIAANLGQLIWALNSNKEHVRYVGKVFALPTVYRRPGPDGQSVLLKEHISQMITRCEETIAEATLLRDNFKAILITIFQEQIIN